MTRKSSSQSSAVLPPIPKFQSRSKRAASAAPSRQLRSSQLPTPLPSQDDTKVTKATSSTRQNDPNVTKDAVVGKVKNTDVSNLNDIDNNSDDNDDDDDYELDFAEVSRMDRDPHIWISDETMCLFKWLAHVENRFRLNNPSIVAEGQTKDIYQAIVTYTKASTGSIVTRESVKSKLCYFRMKYREAVAMATSSSSSSSTVSGPQLLERQEKHCPAFERLHDVFNAKRYFKSRPFFELPTPTKKATVTDPAPTPSFELSAPTRKATVTDPALTRVVGHITDRAPTQVMRHVTHGATREQYSFKNGMCSSCTSVSKEKLFPFIHIPTLYFYFLGSGTIPQSSLTGFKALLSTSEESELRAYTFSEILIKRERTARAELENEMDQKRRRMNAEIMEERIRLIAEMAKERQQARLEIIKDREYAQLDLAKEKRKIKHERSRLQEERNKFREQKTSFLYELNSFTAVLEKFKKDEVK